MSSYDEIKVESYYWSKIYPEAKYILWTVWFDVACYLLGFWRREML